MNSRQKRVFALLHLAQVKGREPRLNLLSWMTCRNITSSNDLTDIELSMVIDMLERWKDEKTLVKRAMEYGMTNEYANEDEYDDGF